MYNCVICRYHEIATKGNNRNMFERCLCDNIRHLLGKRNDLKIRRVRGRIWVERPDCGLFEPEQLDAVLAALPRAFGVESFSPARLLPPDMDRIRAEVIALIPKVFAPFPADRPFTFRVRARRSNKKFPRTSKEIEIDLISAIAAVVGDNRFKIDLDQAELTLGCEIRDEFALLYFNRYPGPGGLPVGSNPKVLTLLSGGIDSPVAAYQVMKRGSATDFVTFHSSPYTPPETIDKVKRIAAKLNTFQTGGKLFIVNLVNVQKAIRDNCLERLRTVLYRRAMIRIAERLAMQHRCRALVTGESLGQVASQTMVNLDTINHVADMMILRPLIGEDKLDTIAMAEKIGTMPLSQKQVPDSCTVFAPSSPATAVPRELAEKEELKMANYAELLNQAVATAEVWESASAEQSEDKHETR